MSDYQHPTKRVIAFTGPPGSGKDTATMMTRQFIQEKGGHFKSTHMKMAEPLKACTHALFGMFHSPDYYDRTPEGRAQKDKPEEELFGMSPRQAYIRMSEELIKPHLGHDLFGKLAVVRMRKNQYCPIHVFSDGGFLEEWIPVVEYIGARSLLVVQLRAIRNGSPLTFEGDSRGFIGAALTEAYPSVTVRDIPNTISKDPDDKEMLRAYVYGVVGKFLGIAT